MEGTASLSTPPEYLAVGSGSLISEHLIYNSSAMQTHISNTTWALPHIPVKLVVCFTEASMAYYHFLELCLEFRPVGQSAAS